MISGIYQIKNLVSNNTYFGKHHSEEVKLKMSLARKKYFEEKRRIIELGEA